MVSFSKNKILSAAVFASVLLLDNNNSEFNNNLFSKNAKGLNSNKRLLHESQAHAANAHHAADANHGFHFNLHDNNSHTLHHAKANACFDDSHHDDSHHDGAHHDDAHHDGAHHDDAHHDGAHHDGAHHDGAHHDGAHHDGAHHNATTHHLHH
ncbi:hypothetical protein PFMALIP_06087 [Plasmodium falciparum MaliPS096_E11]|uniref:Histidine-rich protein III n=1 Tax=Plasmodium falciparum MaliPS096_E11 TaxID=1036727 RepID=A0A024WH28_PLAFA|nr:hypothetical protein PFMALIP_06087 [Plasmodium falciparum MaliPS096_E11]